MLRLFCLGTELALGRVHIEYVLVDVNLLEWLVDQGRGFRRRVVKLGHHADFIVCRTVPFALNALLLFTKAWQRWLIHCQIYLITSHTLLARRLERLNLLWCLDAAATVVELSCANRVLLPLFRHLANFCVQHCVDSASLVIWSDWNHVGRLL